MRFLGFVKFFSVKEIKKGIFELNLMFNFIL